MTFKTACDGQHAINEPILMKDLSEWAIDALEATHGQLSLHTDMVLAESSESVLPYQMCLYA